MGAPVLRILVVDDDHDSAKMLGQLLMLQGYAVEVATDGRKALEQAKQLRPHIVLLDTAMPGQDGNETTRQLRQDPNLDGTTIIAVSGYCRESDRQTAIEAGADGLLAKPLDLEQLNSIVRARVDQAH